MPENLKILLVDDHSIFREGLRLVLEARGGFVVAEAASMQEALDKAPRAAPDTAIVDLSLRGSSGLELIQSLRKRMPKLGIVAFSVHPAAIYAARALRAGANAYVNKGDSLALLVEAIRHAVRGECFVGGPIDCAGAMGRPDEQETGPHLLSDRELEVFHMIGGGRSTRDIATTLRLSVKTVEAYRARLKEKLALSSGNALVVAAVSWVQGLDRAATPTADEPSCQD